MITLLVLTLVALAQEPETAGPPAGWTELTPVESLDPVVVPTQLDEDVDYEVTVWGEHAVRQARAEVVRAMEDQGWEMVRDRDGVYIFKGPEPWMGRAHLYRDGRFDFTRPVVVPTGATAMDQPGAMRIGDPNPRLPPETLEYGADIDRLFEPGQSAGGGAVTPSGALGVGFQAPGKRKVEDAQARALHGVRPELGRYRAVVRETAFQDALDELPARLDALWERGVALEGEGRLLGPVDRRQAVLHHWASRADTPEGDGVRRVIALWLRETVMDSDHPVTPQEKAEAEAEAGRTLDLGQTP